MSSFSHMHMAAINMCWGQPTAQRLLLLTGGSTDWTGFFTSVVSVGGLMVGDFWLCNQVLHQPHVSLSRHGHPANAHLCPLHGHLHKKTNGIHFWTPSIFCLRIGWIKRFNESPVLQNRPNLWFLYCELPNELHLNISTVMVCFSTELCFIHKNILLLMVWAAI